MLAIVDTHQHLWDMDQFSLPWLADVEALRRNYLMSDYLQTSAHSNVAKTVYMEVDVTPEQQTAEAEFVIEMSGRDDNPMAGGVIGGYPGRPGFRQYIEPFKDAAPIKGIRQVLHVPTAAPGHCLTADFVRDVQYLGELGKSFDLCMRPSELADAVALVKQCPDTMFILDHCGNADPSIVNGAAAHDADSHGKAQWEGDIGALGQCENAVCKISGIIARVTEGWTADTLAPTVNHCLDSFGPDRVVFGGDWPVCTLGASFGEWAQALREILAGRSEQEQAQLLAGNAERLYGLD